MKKAAVIGLGDIARIHVPILQKNPQVDLVAVCDIVPGADSWIEGNVPFYTDYQEMIEKEKPDCVHVCLPHYLHYPVTKWAVEHGVDVYCEKPLALNTQQALDFARLEQEHPERKICIGLQNRLNETVEAMQKILAEGKCGKVTGVRGLVPWFRDKAYYETKPWRGKMETAGGGCMINQAIHTLDLMYVLGGEIESIHGVISQLLDYGIEVEDTVSARLYYKSGAIGMFQVSIAGPKNENVELTITTEKEEYVLRDNVLYRRADDGELELIVEDGRLPGTKFYYGASHTKLINRFYRALEEDTQDYIHVREAVMSIRLIDTIRRSSSEGAIVRV